MKKVAIIIASIFLVSALSTVGLVLKKDVEYYINTSSFNTTVAYQEDVDVSTLIIEKYVDGELSNKVPVDKTMIKNCDSTASVGEKSLTIKYNDQEFLINFIVKYKIEFLLDETVIDTQYVLKASEIEAPQDPVKPGFEFIGWDEIPEVINSNKTINALFSNVPSNIPNLGTLTATYGDTLNQFILPSNSEGHWEFVDDLTTTVGNVGKNEFMVQFIPVNSELTVVKDYVYINVSKKKLEFKDIQTEIAYDGNEHIPSYTLDVEGLEVRYNGQKGKEEGSYLYIFTIIDDNYEGNCMGYFNIVPAQVNVKVVLSQYEINLGEAFPTITYEVTGANEEDLQLSFEKPMINHAGEYVVKPTVGNSSYTLVSIEPATLIVKKIYLGPGLPEFLNIPVYGDVLSSVEFLMDNPNGKFEWENPDYVFTTVGEVTVNMIFTPYSTLDYEVEIMPVTFNVPKKELSFNILQSEYVYDGSEHTILYEIIDNPGNLNVVGNIVRTNVTTETITLEIVDDFYSGCANVTLKISKATPVTDFTAVYNAYIGQTLNEISLPEGYAWDANLSLDINDEEGTYYGVTYTPVDTLNFEVVKGQMLVKVYKYTPSDIVVNTSLPSSLVYTGDVIDLESYFTSPYIGGKLSFEYQILKDEIYDNIENILNVGAYKIIVTLLENEIYYSTSIEKVISITPANEVVELVKLYATYGDTLSLINIPFEEY